MVAFPKSAVLAVGSGGRVVMVVVALSMSAGNGDGPWGSFPVFI